MIYIKVFTLIKQQTTFSITCGIIFILLIALTIIFIKFDCEKCETIFNIITIIIFSLTFFGFFIYSLVIYFKVYNNNESFKIAKSIKADKFIENFLKEFSDPFEKGTLILCSIAFFSLSALLYISAWISFGIKKYIKNKENNKNNNNQYYQRNDINPTKIRNIKENRFNERNIEGNMNSNEKKISSEIYQVETKRELNNDENLPEERNIHENININRIKEKEEILNQENKNILNINNEKKNEDIIVNIEEINESKKNN